MKKYVIINGTDIVFIHAGDNIEAASIAVDICDLSNEVIVREYNTVYNSIINNKKKMKKEDLKHGMYVELKNHETYVGFLVLEEVGDRKLNSIHYHYIKDNNRNGWDYVNFAPDEKYWKNVYSPCYGGSVVTLIRENRRITKETFEWKKIFSTERKSNRELFNILIDWLDDIEVKEEFLYLVSTNTCENYSFEKALSSKSIKNCIINSFDWDESTTDWDGIDDKWKLYCSVNNL